LILDGETGFLVNSLEEMVDKIAVVDTLSRKACREHVEKKFSIDSLVAGYTNAYEDVVKHWRQYVSAQKAILRD
jgi:glycosyltransferase involved in cell wall biosynthesis